MKKLLKHAKNTDKSQLCYAKREKKDTEVSMLNNSIYMIVWERHIYRDQEQANANSGQSKFWMEKGIAITRI